MHDLLRDMGREIVCQEAVKYPGQRSRLWHCENTIVAVKNCKVTDLIEGLALNMDGPKKVFGNEAFTRMQNLRLLQLNYVRIAGNCEPKISKELRWLCWHRFPLNSIPKKFCGEKLVALDMQYSNLKQVWKDKKVLENLKFLNLSHSHLLTRITTDFIALPNLEKLILEDCRGLKTIDKSIGSLDKLRLLDLKECANLGNLPKSICRLKSLSILDLDGCLKLNKLPEEIGEIESLTVLSVDRTAIREVPVSIVHLKNLQDLSLCGCKGTPSKQKIPDSKSLLPNSLFGLTSLTTLSLQFCNLSEGMIPEDIGSLSSLKDLDLGFNHFYSLPASIGRLRKLENLWLYGCTNLIVLPELPSSLGLLVATYISLKRLPDLSKFSEAPVMFLNDCNKLAKFPFTEYLLESWYGRGRNVFDHVLLCWSEIPDWFRNQRMGNVLSFQVPPDMSMLLGMVLCVIYAAHDFQVEELKYFVEVTNITKRVSVSWSRNGIYKSLPTPYDHLSLGFVLLQETVDSGDEVKIEIDTRCELIVKKCGVIPVYIEANKRTKMDIQEEVNEFSSSSGNGSVMVVHDQGRQHEGNNDDESGPGHAGEKGERKCSDEAAGPSHYWSYGADRWKAMMMICDEARQ